jgi:hypothetical protein
VIQRLQRFAPRVVVCAGLLLFWVGAFVLVLIKGGFGR